MFVIFTQKRKRAEKIKRSKGVKIYIACLLHKKVYLIPGVTVDQTVFHLRVY